jgi:hypothetical protein
MLGMCYILCKIGPMYCTFIWEQGGGAPRFFFVVFAFIFCGVSAHGFLILVKELGLLTNLGQWIRGLDDVRYTHTQ